MGALDADEVRHDTLGLTGVVEMPEPTAEELATLNPVKKEETPTKVAK
jgi:hypothetical protein